MDFLELYLVILQLMVKLLVQQQCTYNNSRQGIQRDKNLLHSLDLLYYQIREILGSIDHHIGLIGNILNSYQGILSIHQDFRLFQVKSASLVLQCILHCIQLKDICR